MIVIFHASPNPLRRMRDCSKNTWAPAAGRGPGSNTPAEQGAVWQPAPTSLRHFHASPGAPLQGAGS